MKKRIQSIPLILVGLLAVGVAVVSASYISISTDAPKATLPNILLILTDDQGYHDVAYYGTKDLQTPNIDQITREGMRFDNFYANSTVCSPTRAALLTGRYPDYVGVPGVIRTRSEDSWGYLDPKARLLPARLKKAGYQTALIGKWHLGLESPNTPNEHGFDYFQGWLGDMMDDYWTHRRHNINYMRKDKQTIDPQGHATDLFTQWSVDYIKKQAKSQRPNAARPNVARPNVARPSFCIWLIMHPISRCNHPKNGYRK
jgi:arylsulfatase A-like enzyme